MRTTRLRRGLAVAALVPLLAGLTACGDDDKDDDGATASESCGTLPTADPAAALPTGFPALDDQVLYEPSTQGSTKIVFALFDEGDFVEVRDELGWSTSSRRPSTRSTAPTRSRSRPRRSSPAPSAAPSRWSRCARAT
jgi:hypothetical protein